MARLDDDSWHIDGHYATGILEDEGTVRWAIWCPWERGTGDGEQPCVVLVDNTEPQPPEPAMDCCGASMALCEHWQEYESWSEFTAPDKSDCWLSTYMDDSGESLWVDPGPWQAPINRKVPIAWRGEGHEMESFPQIVHADVVRAARDPRMAAVLVEVGRLGLSPPYRAERG